MSKRKADKQISHLDVVLDSDNDEKEIDSKDETITKESSTEQMKKRIKRKANISKALGKRTDSTTKTNSNSLFGNVSLS